MTNNFESINMFLPAFPSVALRSILMACIASMPAATAHADTPPGARWQPVTEFWDEFNGEALDNARWTVQSRYYPGKPPGLYLPRNVSVAGGMLQLWAKQETVPGAPAGYHTYTTAYVSSRKPILYGYFEVRAKPMKARIDSGFWLYRWTETGTYEIDVFEVGGTVPGKESLVHTNAHVYIGDPAKEDDSNRVSDPKSWALNGARLADDFHVYGMEWNEKELRFYFDGTLIRTKANTHWHVPMQVRFSAETQPSWFGLPREGELPAAFLVDYVRVWQKAGESAGTGGAQ